MPLETETSSSGDDRVVLNRNYLIIGSIVVILLSMAGIETMGGAVSMGISADGSAADISFLQTLYVYLWIPIVCMASIGLLMYPGILLAAIFQRTANLTEFLLSAFLLSLVSISLSVHLVSYFSGSPIIGSKFLLVTAVLISLLLGIYSAPVQDIKSNKTDSNKTLKVWLVALPLLLLVLFMPKFLWEAMNGDSAQHLEATRLLIHTNWFFWPEHASLWMRADPNLTTLLYVIPASWFVRLFGELEVAIRLPYLMYIPLMMLVVVALVQDRQRKLAAMDISLIGLCLLLVSFVLFFNATYDPHAADISVPAARGTLLMLNIFSFIYFFQQKQIKTMFAFGFLAYLTAPSGAPLLIFWLAAVYLAYSPRPWKPYIFSIVLVVFCVLSGALLPSLFELLGLPVPGLELRAGRLLDRVNIISLINWDRFPFFIVPCGILPVLSMVLWHKQDSMARAMTLVTLAYFALVFFPAYRLILHHFIPIMFLPIVVYWRIVNNSAEEKKALIRGATFAFLVLGAWLSWPNTFDIYSASRNVGYRLSIPQTQYDNFDIAAYDHDLRLLGKLFPVNPNPDLEGVVFSPDALSFYPYAFYPKSKDQEIDYTIDLTESDIPGKELGSMDGFSLYSLDEERHKSDIAMQFVTPIGSDIYYTPRHEVFHSSEDKKVVNVLLAIKVKILNPLFGYELEDTKSATH